MATPNPNPRTLLDAADAAWMNQAACDGATTEFVPDQETVYALAAARLYCDGCPVRQDCLSWAMLHRAEGIWGGTSTYERSQLLRVRTRAKCPLCKGRALVETGDHELCLACGTSWVRDARVPSITATPAPAGAA